MGAIPPAVFVSRLRKLDDDEVVQFVADVWAHSGWETGRAGECIVAERGSRTERLLVLPSYRFPRLHRVDVPADVDRVVIPVPGDAGVPRGVGDLPVEDANDLRERLLYGTDSQLCQEALGVPARDTRWKTAEPSEPHLLLAPEECPVSRRQMLGALGAGTLGVGGLVAWEQFDDDPSAPPLEVDPPVPSIAEPPDVDFVFQQLEGAVRVVHDGGDAFEADEVVFRGSGFRGSPERRWNQVVGDDPGDTVTAGNHAVLRVTDSLDLRLVWVGGLDSVQLTSYTWEPDGFGGRPDLELAFNYDNGQVVVYHAGDDTVRAAFIRLRGTGFAGMPEVRWNDGTVIDQNYVEPDDFASFAAEPDVTIEAYWDPPRVTELVGQFTGPARPLNPDGDDFPMVGYDPANTGFAKPVDGPTGAVEPRWTSAVDEPVRTPIAVKDGRVYAVTESGTVFALDAEDGARLWRYELAADPSETVGLTVQVLPVRLDGGVEAQTAVFAADSEGRLYALDAASGDLRWTYADLDAVTTTPLVIVRRPTEPSLLVFGERFGNGALLGLDAKNGSDVRFSTGEPCWVATNTTPGYDGESLYVGTSDGQVTATSPGTWEVDWTTPSLVEHGTFAGPLTVGSGRVYAALSTGGVYAFDTEDGVESWSRALDRDIRSTPVLVPHDDAARLVVTDNDGTVTAIETAGGTIAWQTDVMDLLSTAPVGYPTDDGTGAIVVSGEESVLALDADSGEPRWQQAVGAPVRSTPAVADRSVFVGDEDGRVHAIASQ